MTFDLLNLIIGVITGGGLITLITVPQVRKKADAEARKAVADAKATEIANMKSVADGWKDIAEERQEACKEKDQRIEELTRQVDERYVDIGNWRDKYNAQQEEITALKVDSAAKLPKICEKRGCPDRTPPSGY
jgi:chromosome segregation ATPase